MKREYMAVYRPFHGETASEPLMTVPVTRTDDVYGLPHYTLSQTATTRLKRAVREHHAICACGYQYAIGDAPALLFWYTDAYAYPERELPHETHSPLGPPRTHVEK